MTKTTTTAKSKTIRMPGKERPAASQLGSKGLPRRSLTLGILVETGNPPTASPTGANRRGSRLPIPSEPAPCHRPWITPQGATPEERNHHIKHDFGISILALQSHAMA